MSKEGRKKDEGGESSKRSEMREGDWLCAGCDAHNYNARVTCFKCTMSKVESEVRLKGKSALDWECFRCNTSNYGWRLECFKCHITRQGSDDLKARQVGVEWFCKFCDLKNFPNRSDCFKCKRGRGFCSRSPPRGMNRGFSPGRRSPPRRRGMSPPPRRPLSPYRSPRGRSPVRRRSRSPVRQRRPSPRRMSPPPSQDEEWKCNLCGVLNGVRRNDCYKCTTPKPNDSRPGPSGSLLGQVFGNQSRADQNSEGWECPECLFKNYNFRKDCFKCRAKKPDDLNRSHGKSLLSTPDDYYQPESPTRDTNTRQQYGPDWSCKFCNVDIFPTRNDCYRCGRTKAECEVVSNNNDQFTPFSQNKRSSAPLIADRPAKPNPDGYTCGCGTFTRNDESSCNWCGKPNPNCHQSRPYIHENNQAPQLSHNNQRGQDWDCRECKINNYPQRLVCFKCKKPREEVEEVRGWEGPGEDRRMSAGRSDRRAERSPPRRTLLNHSSRSNTFNSRYSPPPNRARSRSPIGRYMSPPRRGGGFSPTRRGRSPPFMGTRGRSPPRGAPPGRGRNFQPDWECRECKINNFVKRIKCFRCGKDRSEVEVILNERGNPIGPNDWLCPKCNGHNFSRRDDCFKCKTERPNNKRAKSKKPSSEDIGDDLNMQGNMDRVQIDAI